MNLIDLSESVLCKKDTFLILKWFVYNLDFLTNKVKFRKIVKLMI